MTSGRGIAIDDAERVLKEMLRQRGLDPETPRSVGETWDVFKDFAAVAFETSGPESDGVLYQIGIYSFYGKPEFYIDFLRQFEITYDDGEHDHFEHLHCEFRFAATDELRAFGNLQHWWFADEGADAWWAYVALIEQRPEFRALRSALPEAAKVEQERV
jgi:hypothetical protein